MSFGALLGFNPSSTSRAFFHVQGKAAIFWYESLGLGIQIVSGLSTLCGLYATIIFSLTILYGKSAVGCCDIRVVSPILPILRILTRTVVFAAWKLGAERDVQYDDFLRKTARARIHGFKSFSYSLGLFSMLAMLVFVERISFRTCSLPALCTASFILFKLYKDWRLLFQNAETIYSDAD